MFTVNSYLLAVIFCIVTMICWGSWGNTQKLVSKNWRYELFYWDYVIGMVLFTILLGFTMVVMEIPDVHSWKIWDKHQETALVGLSWGA